MTARDYLDSALKSVEAARKSLGNIEVGPDSNGTTGDVEDSLSDIEGEINRAIGMISDARHSL